MTRATALLLALVLFVAGCLWSAAVWGHDPYFHWQRPDGGGSCCSGDAVTGDCRRVRAAMGDDGLWRAQTPAGWLIVPRDKILPFNGPDGDAHLCEQQGVIYCFTEPQPKS